VIGLVVVSHSHPLAVAAVELAREMTPDPDLRIVTAAGLDDTTLGTDAVRIQAGIEAADSGDGVVVLMDLGSAVLSAELACELLDPPLRERTVLCPAPLVEGLVVAAVSAASGAGAAEVAGEAGGALAAKLEQLGPAGPAALAGAAHAPEAPADSAPGAGTAGSATPEHGTPGAGSATGAAGATESVVFTVVNEHGLHARPASRLVLALRDVTGRAELRNLSTGSGWVPATSLSRVATLGAARGHELELRLDGPEPRPVLARVEKLAAGGFGEPPSSAAPPAPARPAAPPAPAPTTAVAPVVTRGVVAGIGDGPARPLGGGRPEVPDTPAGPPDQESQRLDRALERVRAELAEVAERTRRTLGAEQAEIFEAHQLLTRDPDLADRVRAGLRQGRSAARAWADAVDEVAGELAALPDEYLRARAADVEAVGNQVLRELLGPAAPGGAATGEAGSAAGGAPAGGAPAGRAVVAGVVVAADLTPAEAAALDPALVSGVLLARGSATSHATILLRAKGIPTVVGAGDRVLELAEGTPLVLDGGTGDYAADPDPELRERYRQRAARAAGRARAAAEGAHRPALTLDGMPVAVGANIGALPDAVAAAAAGAEHAGLVRTEFLFADRDHAPDAGEQEAEYRRLAEALGGRRMTLRTLDVGGDKPLRYLPMPAEDNPYLGVRGVRLTLAHPELLAEQLLAVVRVAADTPVSVMFPMVATVAELVAARRALDDAVRRSGAARPAGLEVGIMVEVPAAALKSRVLARHVDFFSIGTNDLTQYALAADRGNTAVSSVGDPYDPGLLRLVRATCEGAAGQATVAVCGELAGDERAAPLLLGLGVRELSVAPRAVPLVKQAVREVDLGRAAELAARALDAESADAVRALLAGDR
jgi:multiphosphoryl transfer protein